MEACKKLKLTKRKPFDSRTQRKLSDEGSTSPPPVRSDSKSASKNGAMPPARKTSWRQQHEEFIRTVRAARGEVLEDEERDVAGSEKRVPAGYIQCPTCDRSFNRKAAERHIAFCADQKARQKSPPVNSNDAMSKFKARNSYKASPAATRKAGASIAVPVSRVPGNNVAVKKATATSLVTKKPSDSTTTATATTGTSLSNSRRTSDKAPAGKRVNTHRSLSPTSRRAIARAPLVTNTSSRVKAMLESSNVKATPKTPVVKFKDKFPNGGTSVTSQYLKETNSVKEMFKRPDTNFSHVPRTVPGVRTGGMSPTRGFAGLEDPSNNSNSTFSSSISLMKRSLEDLYLRDTQKTPIGGNSNDNSSKNGFVTNGVSLSEIRRSPTNGNGRGSTSGSSGGDVDHLPNRVVKSSGDESNGRSSEPGSSMPRWCHQCGTKYPMTVAKYCYECGARRLGTLASLV